MITAILAEIVGEFVAVTIDHTEAGINHYAVPLCDWPQIRREIMDYTGVVLPEIVAGKLEMPQVKLDQRLN